MNSLTNPINAMVYHTLINQHEWRTNVLLFHSFPLYSGLSHGAKCHTPTYILIPITANEIDVCCAVNRPSIRSIEHPPQNNYYYGHNLLLPTLMCVQLPSMYKDEQLLSIINLLTPPLINYMGGLE